MNKNIICKIITHDDIIKSSCFDMVNAIDIVESSLKEYAQGNVIYPDKVSQIFDNESQSRINCLPATLLTEKISGMKWVSVFPCNPKRYQIENLTAVILLSEIESGYPIAFMEATLCSALRTAAISAVAAKKLAKHNSAKVGIVGAGEQAKMHFIGMKTVYPNISYCKVVSRTSSSEQNFITVLSKRYPDVIFEQCYSNYEKACLDVDILISAISGQEPIIKSEWLSEGIFYCHVGGWEDEYDVALNMNKIVTDDWESVKHRSQTLSRMYKEGLLCDCDIYANLHEIIVGNKIGRESILEKIYFNSVGLSFIDVALGYNFYKKVCEASLGRDVILREHNIFNDL